jgi:uncharacterized phage infection (PIP) family protein YhgE
MTKFPKAIWDGKSASRKDLDVVKGPDHKDWMALIGEVQSMQRYILNLSGSLEAMPNVSEAITDAKEKVDGLLNELKRLAPPADLTKEVTNLWKQIGEIDVREEHVRLKNGVKKLFLRLRAMEKAYKDLRENVYYQLEVLTNNTRNQISDLRRAMEARYANLEEQVKELQDVLANPELD